METVLVLGASPNPGRYSYKAVQHLRAKGHRVIALGRKRGVIGDTPILDSFPIGEKVDTITLYLNPENQKGFYPMILDLRPRRIIYNPGTENLELEQQAKAKGIENLIACTLVLLASGQY